MARAKPLVVRALRTEQVAGVPLYAFFMRGRDLMQIADISRISREGDALRGFQREAITRHVKSITDYLNQGPGLFPNAIILALSPRARFATSRGTKPTDVYDASDIGTLFIPVYDVGSRAAWVVDGQQRSIALAKAHRSDIPVPVIAFASDDVDLHRQQFVLVNKVRPLRASLVDELLPEVTGYIPKDLSIRRLPSALVDALSSREDSPLCRRISRPSMKHKGGVSDRPFVNMIRRRITNTLGALAPLKPTDNHPGDADAMIRLLIEFWGAVKSVFPQAWSLPPDRSRLLHGAGIESLGALMDRYAIRFGTGADFGAQVRRALQAIAPHCAWTAGAWPNRLAWNAYENTPRAIRGLTDQLIQLDLSTQVNRAA